MVVLTCKNLEKSYGTKTILKDINFNVESGDKIGIVGLNGSGKTTLFNILSKNLFFDKGDLYVRNGMKLGYLEQHINIDSDNTMFEECLTVFKDLIKMEEELRELELAITKYANNENKLENLMTSYSSLSEKFSELNGYGYESNIRGTLIGLGFSEEDFSKKVNILSGGQKSRVSLAKLLLERPDILLLDEPTNHLDIAAIDWLAKFIQDYTGATLLISHDRYFLDMVVNKIFHLENKTLKEYRTNYTNFIKRRKENIEIYKKHYEENQQEIEKQKKIIDQYKRYGGERYNRLAKSRQKLLDKMEVMEKHVDQGQISFTFKPQIESGNDVLQVVDLAKNFGDRKLFKNISFNIYKGDRIGLIGPNGVGKSTLFKIILNKITDYEGEVNIGHHVNLGYFDQEMSDLNLNNTIIDEIWDDNPNLTHTEIRNILSQFMFLGDDVFKEIKDLSGGEKGRLSILKIIMSKDNFLLMDEPTNHLDIDSKEVLEDALINYEGTVFVISHDRYFLNRVADKIFVMTEDGIIQYLGNYDYYIEKINEAKSSPNEDVTKTKTQIQIEKKKEKELIKEERKKKKEISSLEKEIHDLEIAIGEIDGQLANNEIYSDTEKVLGLTKSREEKVKNLDILYEKWMDYSDL